MTSLNQDGFGDWYERNSLFHRELYKKLEGLSTVESDDEFKKQAVKNIINHPQKYLFNWFKLVERLYKFRW
jgi:hypothetical protein